MYLRHGVSRAKNLIIMTHLKKTHKTSDSLRDTQRGQQKRKVHSCAGAVKMKSARVWGNENEKIIKGGGGGCHDYHNYDVGPR